MYYAVTDSNGNITAFYSGYETYPKGIPSSAIEITDTQWQQCINNQGKYIVQNGSLVLAPAPTAAQQLASAQSAQKALLQKSFDTAISAGFPSSASGTSATYSIDGNAMAKWNGILSLINAGTLTSNITVKDINGVKTTLTTAQFKTFAMDGFTYFNTQEQTLWTKETDVENATTVADVQAVTW